MISVTHFKAMLTHPSAYSVRNTFRAILYFLLYWSLAEVGISWSDGFNLSSGFAPAIGLGVAAVLTYGNPFLWVVFAGHFFALIGSDIPFLLLLGACALEVLTVYAAVFLLRRFFHVQARLENVGHIWSFVCVGLLTPVLVSVPLGLSLFWFHSGGGPLFSESLGEEVTRLFAGNAIGILVYGGTFLLWMSENIKRPESSKMAQSSVIVAFYLLIIGFIFYASDQHSVLYLLLPPMMIASFFMAPRQVATLLAVTLPLMSNVVTLQMGPWKSELYPLVWANLYFGVMWSFSMISVLLTRRLIQAQEMLREISFAKSRFLTRVSHEIRTPLNSIVGLIDQLRETPLTDSQQTYVEVMERSGESLLRLVNEVLDLSKIESGKLNLEVTDFSIRNLVEDVHFFFQPRIRNKHLNFDVVVDTNVPPTWRGDAARVKQALINLISNSIKFTNTGGVRLEVHMVPSLISRTPNLEFAIVDSGIGIPEDKLSMIFEPFTQADNSATRKYGGTGLGLSICREVIHLMKGRLAVESRVGVGSVFRFAIPELEVPPLVELGVLEGVRRPSTISVFKPSQDHALRILLADDNVDNRFLIRSYLKGLPILLEEAQNGREALDSFERNSFDLILMDIEMPEMDGIEATRGIRISEKNRLLHRTPIIAITAHAMLDERDKMLNAGCDSFLVKPLSKAHFLKSIWQVLDRGLESSSRSRHDYQGPPLFS